MKKEKVTKMSWLIVAILALQMIWISPVKAEDYSGYLDEVLELVKERYYQDVPDNDFIKGALKGIFNTMDDYTTFFDMDEASQFMSSMEGNYQGIGVEITQVPEGILVTRVFENSPAKAAGIAADDRIVEVDGVSIQGRTATEASSLIRGETGTYVELSILRGTATHIQKIRVQRAVVNISPVTWQVEGDVMVIQLSSFSANSSAFFDEALQEMDKLGLKKMILDLRNNPGGEVNQAVSIARKLVRKGLITKLDFKSEKTQDQEYYSYMDKPKYIPAVLVNEYSASASEILASAIQDSGDGILIGTNTFGKGVVQQLYPILTPQAYGKYKQMYGDSIVDAYDWIAEHGVIVHDSELIGWTKITTGHYLTRNGKSIHGEGVVPDFVVGGYEVNGNVDIQDIKPLDANAEIVLMGVGNDVYQAEKILTLKGHNVDTPDTVLDEKTSDALKLYQQQKKLPITGMLDLQTGKALNAELKQLRLQIDLQYAKALELLSLFQ